MKAKIFITILALFFFTCKDKQAPTETIDPQLQKIAGNYKASTFIIPDKTDGKYDVLKAGGYLELTLSIDKRANGKIYIPPSNQFGDTTGLKEIFSGYYTFKNDSLQLKGINNFLNNPQLFFVSRNNVFEAKMGVISPTIIVLVKE